MTVRFVLAASALLLSVGCSSNSSPSSPAPASGTSVSIVRGAETLTTTAYAPNPVTVPVGGTVTWINNDTTTHTSTAGNGSFDSGNIAPGGRFSVTFPAAGSFPYRCTLHPNMIGTVTVQ